ncbi:MAG: hypothetical protein E7237_07045 [Sarcina sp.]|nr:hypothetical protein [Sarcina sp.]
MSGELVNHYHWFGLEAFLGFFRPVQLFLIAMWKKTWYTFILFDNTLKDLRVTVLNHSGHVEAAVPLCRTGLQLRACYRIASTSCAISAGYF